MKQISVKISAVGKPTIEALGFQGQNCQSATAGLEAKLGGGAVDNREMKAEYYEAETEQQTLTY